MHSVIVAVIFLPPGQALDGACARQCLEHIGAKGYELLSVVRDWGIAWGLIHSGAAEVLVVARPEHVDPERLPRFEIAGHGPADDRPAVMARGRPRDSGRRPKQIRTPPADR